MLTASAAAAVVRVVETDVCIYGGTSGGIIAAVEAARSGRRVVLVEPGLHLGGMTTGGLGNTDRGNAGSIGGLAAEFYRRVEAKYGPGPVSYLFEPKAASQVFAEMLAEQGIVPFAGEELKTVRKSGTVIQEIETQTGLVVRAGMFMDTTYEGDLLAAASVSFMSGREANTEFSETLNGIRPVTAGAGFSALLIDPYVTPGNAASALLPGISPALPGTAGAADDSLQAYNYRLCLVQSANRLPIAPPSGYRAEDYELAGRWLAAKTAAGQTVTLGGFTDGLLHRVTLKNGKTDWNANQGPSSDWVGMSREWPTASSARRREIAKAHEDYYRGIFEFLRTDPRVPAAVKTELATWGLPADEFMATGGWPPQVYVREARRMRGVTVLTEQHGRGTVIAPEPVALASYAMDSHACRLIVVNGLPTHEGGFFVTPPAPWGIPLAALTPRSAECSNLLATFALSATHAAFASARMEPVFMMTSHAAAAAACQALQAGTGIQAVPLPSLRTTLRSEGQILEWGGGQTAEGIVVEAEGAGGLTSGGWTAGSNAGYHGTGYWHDGDTRNGTRTATFTPVLPASGDYRVSLWWVQHTNRADNVPVTLTHSSGSATVTVNQRLDPDNNTTPGGWLVLGTWNFAAGGNAPRVLLSNTGTNGFVIADAVRFEPVNGTVIPVTVEMAAPDAIAAETGGDPARVVFRRAGLLTSPLTVNFSVSGTATPGTDTSALTGAVSIPANQAQTTLTVSAVADTLAEGDESLTLTLAAGSYLAGPAAAVTLTIRDRPFDAWRAATFSTAELAAGPGDFDADGLPDLIEWATGSDARRSGDPAPLTIFMENGSLLLALRRGRPHVVLPEIEQADATAGPWSPLTGAALLRTEPGAGVDTEIRSIPSPPPGARRFYRLSLRAP